MAIDFTGAQQRVLDARNHNILVSAAAGSGKTAVLVERIVRLVSEGDHPLDIDRLLVVTFTRAAAAQMRERIGQALSARLREDPANGHLQRQQVLLHNAQITTIDSFCTFLLRNYFSDIDLDPGFRQIEQNEGDLIAAELLQDFLEEKYAGGDPAFLACVSYFCTGLGDKEMERLILGLCGQAGSHPSPEAWLLARADDYDVPDEEALFASAWMQSAVLRLSDLLLESDAQYAAMQAICLQPAGPDVLYGFLQEEREGLFSEIRRLRRGQASPQDTEGFDPSMGRGQASPLRARGIGTFGDPACLRRLWEAVRRALAYDFKRYPTLRGKQYQYMDPDLKDAVKSMRDGEKDRIRKIAETFGGQGVDMILATMEAAREPMRTLAGLALDFYRRFARARRDRHMIDFVDLEHLALDILADRQPDGSYLPRRAARSLRAHFAEILIDEYQDSNEVQEVLLQIISTEDEGKNNRFMVGDIKQSIYRFRLARPEIFMEKYDAYRPGDALTERIELDQNFRSRSQVLDCVNMLFARIMRREVGGVEYSQAVSLKKGALFPDEGTFSDSREDPYRAELLLLDTAGTGAGEEDAPEGGDGSFAGEAAWGSFVSEDPGRGGADGFEGRGGAGFGAAGMGAEEPEEAVPVLPGEVHALTARQKEALLIAGRIRQLVGSLPVRDEETGRMRPARYGDIVILLRAAAGWNEDLRAVFAREGIPAYAESRTGYFAAQEIRVLLGLLKVLDNPRQDIPLYGTLRAYFGDFSQDEIARIRLARREGCLYEALLAAAGRPCMAYAPGAGAAPDISVAQGPNGGVAEGDSMPRSPGAGAAPDVPADLRAKCGQFLDFIHTWRQRARYAPVSELVAGLVEETGYQDYCAALPGGLQRTANLSVLRSQADAFTRTDFTGLFQFLRYIEKLHRQEIDYGEANTLDEGADVVRIMTIHKSKGLEFPICFVAGLSKRFSFRQFDASGQMLFDGDWGVGIHYYDQTTRVRATTLRREEIAEKIRRDCMGEELRVLYVALTRAKEKLILTAADRHFDKKIGRWQSKMAGFFQQEGGAGEAPRKGKLTPSMIGTASSYAELVCEAVMAEAGPEAASLLFQRAQGGEAGDGPQEDSPWSPGQEKRTQSPEDPAAGGNRVEPLSGLGRGKKEKGAGRLPLHVRLVSEEDLSMRAIREQAGLLQREEILRGLEGRLLAAQPDPVAARALADRYFRAYPHAELQELYAHTSVSELKHRAMRAALRQMDRAEGAGEGEGPAELFPEEVPVPYLPRFLRRDDAPGKNAPGFNQPDGGPDGKKTGMPRPDGSGDGRTAESLGPDADSGEGLFRHVETGDPSGARRGTAFHRVLELMDYSRRALFLEDGDQASGKKALSAWMREIVEAGKIPAEDAALVSFPRLLAFLRSPLAGRMAAADARGLLFREQPFLMGISADRVGERLPREETVTVQGIIDAFFVEEGQIILVDYKTDRVRAGEELAMRYQAQLDLYAEALTKAYAMPVREKVIYSTALGREILL